MNRIAAFVATIAFVASARAQTPSTLVTSTPAESIGFVVCDAGDVDHDGFPDWAVAAPGGNTTPPASIGRVEIHSGHSGALLRTYVGPMPEQNFGRSIANAGDVDADGWPDLIVGATLYYSTTLPAGRAFLYSGHDGSLLRSFQGTTALQAFGSKVAGIGDVNGDGRPDVAVGAPGDTIVSSFSGEVIVYSGLDGSVLFDILEPVAGQHFGYAIVGGRDLDHDGRADFVVSAIGDSGTTGYVRAYSGATGAVIFTALGLVNGQRFGNSLAWCGDIDLDGTDDVVVGSYQGLAAILSGANGSFLLQVHGSTTDGFGWAVCAPGDMDGDGKADILVGRPYFAAGASQTGEVQAFSSATGALLATITDPAGSGFYQFFGYSLAAIGDVNGDGVGDFLAGAPAVALARVFLGGIPPPHAYCTAKTNSHGCVPQVTFRGVPSLTSGDLDVGATNVLSHAPGMLFWGMLPATIPFQGGTLCVTGSPIVRTPVQSAGGTSGVSDCSGSYSFHFTPAYLAAHGLVPGSRVCAQWYSRDNGFAYPQNVGLTNAVEFLVGP